MIWLCSYSSSSEAQQRVRSVFSLFDISYHVHYITSCSLRPPFFLFAFGPFSLPPSFFLPFHRLHFWQRSFKLTAVKWWEQGMNTNQRGTVWERETCEAERRRRYCSCTKPKGWRERRENRSCGTHRNPLVSIRCVRPDNNARPAWSCWTTLFVCSFYV